MPFTDFKRVHLAHLPTPLEALPRLTEVLGGPRLLVKRDDCTGLAVGGNKTRKLEFLLAEALAQDADTVITAGGVQSNHVRQTAAAAARCGLACELVLNRSVPWPDPAYEITGNVLLDGLLGAKIHIHPKDIVRDEAMAALAEELRAQGRRPYIIPTGGSNGLGALGYAACALELEAQAEAQSLHIDAVVHATGSGGTQAGLITGFLQAGSATRVIGIDIDAEPEEVAGHVRRVALEALSLLKVDSAGLEAALRVVPGYAGEAYGLPTEAMGEAVRLLARTEGLLLDPVYTGKAFSGLLDLIAKGEFAQDDTVVFLHSGGSPALFAYSEIFRPITA